MPAPLPGQELPGPVAAEGGISPGRGGGRRRLRVRRLHNEAAGERGGIALTGGGVRQRAAPAA